MPTNLPPEYYEAESLYKLAQTPQEKVERLEELIFSNLPRQVLVEYQNKLVTENIRLLETYFCTHPF